MADDVEGSALDACWVWELLGGVDIFSLTLMVGGVEEVHVWLSGICRGFLAQTTIIPKICSAPEGEFAFHFRRFCAFFCVLHMMFEAFGMSGRGGSPGC